jgi:hypothetical protein
MRLTNSCRKRGRSIDQVVRKHAGNSDLVGADQSFETNLGHGQVGRFDRSPYSVFSLALSGTRHWPLRAEDAPASIRTRHPLRRRMGESEKSEQRINVW